MTTTNSTWLTSVTILDNRTPENLYEKWVKKFHNEFDNEKFAYSIIVPFMTVIIILVNSFVLYLFYRERASIKTPQKYIISMVVNDLLVGFAFILMALSFFNVTVFLNRTACIVNSTIGFFILTNTFMTILATASDRYWSIAYPVKYKMQMEQNKNTARNYLIYVWLFSAVDALFSLVSIEDEVDSENGICRFGSKYVTISVLIIPSICLLLLLVLYILIYRNLKQKVFCQTDRQNIFKQIFDYFKKSHDENYDKKLNKEVKTTLILFLTVTAAFTILIPAVVMYAIFKIWPHAFGNSSFYLVVCLFLLHPIVNPLLYVYCISNIRKRGKLTLRKLVTCKDEEESKEVVSLDNLESSQKVTQSTTVDNQ